MPSAFDRADFAPPPQRGHLRALTLAVFAHGLLVVALTYGLHWQRDAEQAAVEAELWAQAPQQAAPPEPVAPPPPPPPLQVPVVKAPPLPDPQVQRDAQIALEREKEKKRLEEEREEELQRERDRKRKLEAQKKREEELARKQEAQKLAAEQKRKDDEKRKREEQNAKKLAQQRDENLKRMQAMAGTGAPSSTGAAAQSQGPSASWAGRVQARVRPNIVFTDDVSGNPKAEVEVRMAPDGTIVGKRLVRSSGTKAWDDAVLRALDKTEMLPRDVDGRVHSPVVIEFRPKG